MPVRGRTLTPSAGAETGREASRREPRTAAKRATPAERVEEASRRAVHGERRASRARSQSSRRNTRATPDFRSPAGPTETSVRLGSSARGVTIVIPFHDRRNPYDPGAPRRAAGTGRRRRSPRDSTTRDPCRAEDPTPRLRKRDVPPDRRRGLRRPREYWPRSADCLVGRRGAETQAPAARTARPRLPASRDATVSPVYDPSNGVPDGGRLDSPPRKRRARLPGRWRTGGEAPRETDDAPRRAGL